MADDKAIEEALAKAKEENAQEPEEANQAYPEGWQGPPVAEDWQEEPPASEAASAEGQDQEDSKAEKEQDPSLAEQAGNAVADKADAKITSIVNEAKAAVAALEKANEELDTATEKSASAEKNLEIANKKYDIASEKAEPIQEKIDAAEEKAEPIQEKIDAAEEKLEDAEEALEEAREGAEAKETELTEGELKAHQDKIDAAKAELEAAEKEMEPVDAELKAAEKEMEPVDAEFDVAKEDLKTAKNELVAAKDGLVAAGGKVAEAANRVTAVQARAEAAGAEAVGLVGAIADGSIINKLSGEFSLGDVDINLKSTRVEAEYKPEDSQWSAVGSLNGGTQKFEIFARYKFDEEATLGNFNNFRLEGGFVSGETGVVRPNEVEGIIIITPVRIGEAGHSGVYDGFGVRGYADYNFGEVDGTASSFILANGGAGLDTSLTYDINDDTRFTGGVGLYTGDVGQIYMSGQIDQNTEWGSYHGRLQNSMFSDGNAGGLDSLTTISGGANILLGEDNKGILVGKGDDLKGEFNGASWAIQSVDLRGSLDSTSNYNVYAGLNVGKAGGVSFSAGVQVNQEGDVLPVVGGSVSF